MTPTSTYPSQSGRRWAVLAAATLTQACACFLVQGLGAMGPALQAGLGLTAAGLGLLMSSAQLVPIVGLPVAGGLLDRFGERRVVAAGVAVVALALAGATLSSGLGGLMLWLALASAGYSTVQPGGSQSVSLWFERSQRGLAMGIRQAGLPLGGAAAAATLPMIAAVWGWRAALWTGAGVAGVGALAFLAVCRSADRPRKTPGATPPGSLMARLREQRGWLRLPAVRGAAVSGATLVAAQVSLLVFAVADLNERFEVSIGTASKHLALMLCAGVLGRILLAGWSDRSRFGRYLSVYACLLAMSAALGLHALGGVRGGLALMVWTAWVGFFGFGWYGPWVAFAGEAAPSGRVGAMLALVMAANQVAIVVSTPLFGLLRDFSGSFVAGWAGLTALLLVASLATRGLLTRAAVATLLDPASPSPQGTLP